ncbi:MAG: hypothetical protein Q9191_004337 [Dirinaria sp. TL-2023a]
MSTKTELQDLLRFLSNDAKVPLAVAMSKVKELQKSTLTSSELIASASITKIQSIFTDERLSKQILSAAKRVSKKRAAGPSDFDPAVKRKRVSPTETLTPAAIEASLNLPFSNVEEDELASTILVTNRAPLVLAFVVNLLKYTMPSQPLSSRLSLAQAVVSVNSKSKAISLGIENGSSAESEGWGQGQPSIRVMGRDVRVMRRWGYDPHEGAAGKAQTQIDAEVENSQSTVKEDNDGTKCRDDEEPALWGLDLEALRSSNGPVVFDDSESTKLPIYKPESARSYILKSFASAPSTDLAPPKKKLSAAALAAEKERNLALLLQSLDLLYASWAQILSTEELDKRAWSWYVAVRPEVQQGVAGWGGKGQVKLSQILDMRRKG